MMGIKYSYEPKDASKAVKGRIDNAKVSFKKTRETSSTLRLRKVEDAIKYLKNVLLKKECVPFFRYNRGCGQTHQARKFSIPAKEIEKRTGEKRIWPGHVQTRGRWPVKSVKTLMSLLESIKENAVSKGLDVSELLITHIQVSKAPKIYGRTFRAHGRINPFNKSPCHIQIVAEIDVSTETAV